jgi:hypothetical protein
VSAERATEGFQQLAEEHVLVRSSDDADPQGATA